MRVFPYEESFRSNGLKSLGSSSRAQSGVTALSRNTDGDAKKGTLAFKPSIGQRLQYRIDPGSKLIVAGYSGEKVRAVMKENVYREKVFLGDMLSKADYQSREMLWKMPQVEQYNYLMEKGVRPGYKFLDLGCGPLRLGVKLIPYLSQGFYYGVDINADTLDRGEQVLSEYGVNANNYKLIQTDCFDLSGVPDGVDFAFSNSLFTHLRLNSIVTCLSRVRQKLSCNGIYCSTIFVHEGDAHFTEPWLRPAPNGIGNNGKGQIVTNFDQDPYHYPLDLITKIANAVGFTCKPDPNYYHRSQTMLVLRPVT